MPRCVESCPTGALVFGDLDDPTSEISLLAKALPVEELHPEYATKPRVKYVGIPKRFIAGEVVFGDKVGECAEGVKVQLVGAGMEMSTATDLFGDFEFEGLEKNKNYKLTVTADGYSTASLDVVTLKDVNLGEIVLAPR